MHTRKKLARFLERAGYLIGDDPTKVHVALARLLGKDRYEQHLDRADAMIAGMIPISEVYSGMQSMQEANVLMSFQGHHVLEVNFGLLEHIADHLATAIEVVELGCWTGAISAYVAEMYPGTRFTGVDAQANAIEFARNKWQRSNLHFSVWNYAETGIAPAEKVQLLFGVFPLDFRQMEESFRLPSAWSNFSQWDLFDERLAEAMPYFRNWRSITYSDARLVLALRIPTVQWLAAVLEAARRAGWEVDLANSLKIKSGDESFPLLQFTALTPGVIAFESSATDLNEWWKRH